MERSCKTCEHSMQTELGDIQCRRYPPVFVFNGTIYGFFFADTQHDACCGEYAPSTEGEDV